MDHEFANPYEEIDFLENELRWARERAELEVRRRKNAEESYNSLANLIGMEVTKEAFGVGVKFKAELIVNERLIMGSGKTRGELLEHVGETLFVMLLQRLARADPGYIERNLGTGLYTRYPIPQPLRFAFSEALRDA